MLVNIISNAIKYSADGSRIYIEVSAQDGWLKLTVRDEGIGLTEEEGKRVFEKFYRSPAASHIPGTGLGLAICKGIADMHGGTITAGPSGERGATVTVELPIIMPAGSEPHEEQGELIHS